jgi:C1A family cysteine protease
LDFLHSHKIDSYHRVPVDLHAMKHCLAEGFPFVMGLQLYSQFMQVKSDGKVRMPSSDDECLGGHAMCVVGYSDKDKTFCVRNSWVRCS